jgi:hypothetical protein
VGRMQACRSLGHAVAAVGGLVVAALWLAPTPVSAAFARRKVLTIDRTRVPGTANHVDFPVLVSITGDPNLRTTANGGSVTSAQGDDILFRAEDATTCAPSASPCRLDHEIEKYDGATGTLVAWVRVPTLQYSGAAANTAIVLYYGDATVTCPQQNKTGVWDTSYREVFHLNESGDHTDSTKNAFAAVGKGAVTNGATGRIGAAVDLAGGADGLTPARLVVSDGTLPATTSFTYEAWVYFRSYVPGGYVGFVTKGRESLNFDGSPAAGFGSCLAEPCGDWVALYKGGGDRFTLGWAWGGGALGCKISNLDDPGAIVNTGQWYQVAATFDVATKTRRLLVNGTQVVTDTGTACLEADIPHYGLLGNDNLADDYLDGVLDEVRVSFSARSNEWIATGYNNQSSPGTFYSVSDQVGPYAVAATACPSRNPCAGGPGTCYLRSIGNTAAYSAGSGSCTATNGSAVVTCPGAAWKTANRGRGDRVTIDGTSYMVLAVDSETQLRLSTPFTGVTGAGTKSYAMSRQFATPQAWENCISSGGAACTYFPVANGNLVTGNRSEVGIVYKDASPYSFAVPGSYLLTIDGSTTDASHTITLTADGVNRHYGVSGAGVVLDNGANTATAVRVQDQFATLEWMEIRNGGSTGAHCVDYVPSSNTNHGLIRNNIVRNCSGQSIRLAGSASNHVVDITNNVIYRGAREGIRVQSTLGTGTGSRVRILNNTLVRNNGNTAVDWTEVSTAETPNPYVVLRNNIIVDDAQTPDVTWNGLGLCTTATTCDWWNAASGNNVTGDAAPPTGQWRSDIGPNPRGGGVASATEASLAFVNTTAGSEDLHIQAGSAARNAGSDLTGVVQGDIDAVLRSAPWDVGADELDGTTAVGLMSFSASPGDGSVTLEWRTGSELDNLGFHLYRGLSPDGPWTRLTSSLVPGLGSSPLGQAYSWLDAGLVNGTMYYYRLEDVDTSSTATSHGPVSAVPGTESSPPGEGGGDGGGGDASERGGGGGDDAEHEAPGSSSCPSWVLAAAPDAVSPVCARYGNPDSTSLQILARDAFGATIELHTAGFWALFGVAGEVQVFVPGLELPSEPTAAALPLRRALVDAVVGKGVELVSAEAFGLQTFRGLRPAAVGAPQMRTGRNGVLRPARRALAPPPSVRGTQPREMARLGGTVFQGDRKSAVVEFTPVRFSGSGLVLARTVRVRLAFTGRVEGEIGTGARGHSAPARRTVSGGVLAQLHTSRTGIHAVTFGQLFPGRVRGSSVSRLRLQRGGEAVPFHVEPPGPVFGPGSTLYFFVDRAASSTEYSAEVAYELVRGPGVTMGTAFARPSAAPLDTTSTGSSSFETNRIYQPGLLEATDPWLWEAIASGSVQGKPFVLSGLATGSDRTARVDVDLQGGSDAIESSPDHHVRVEVNGAPAGEASFDGKRPFRLSAALPASLLREGTNELAVVNLGDTGASSLVFLDRFAVSYPQRSVARSGSFDGTWAETGTVEVSSLSGAAVVVDLARAGVRWVSGFESGGESVRFRAEAGHRYVVASAEGLVSPRVDAVPVPTLERADNQADYLVIAPRELLPAADPLLERRRGQGLSSRAVAFEEIVSEFGHGQAGAEAIRSFLAYAYSTWRRPSPRYVLLLGDATYDPRRFQPTSRPSPLPALFVKTSYLWTASDPALAAVNGDDPLPDMAVGRLPATSRDEADALVSKLLAWEDSGQGLSDGAVLVADGTDPGGDFEGDVEDIRASFLSGRSTTTLKVGELGAATRAAILAAFDEGASLMSYVGHGGVAVWASENVLNTWDVPSLAAQSRQPLLMTMNCLNGYFVAPSFDALPEALIKAQGRGIIAAFSPSGLSLDGPAHEYHRALVAALVSGRHERLGDAVLAAQETYAETGLMPELLEVYQLLGDPAMRLRTQD